MTRYLLSMYQPDGPAPESDILDPIMRDINAVEQQMKTAGVWVFSGGLHAPSTATVVRAKNDDVLITDGPYVEGKEHLGGVTIIEAPDLDVALEWGRKLARAVRVLPIEGRPFHDPA